jgi:hypothetical protein
MMLDSKCAAMGGAVFLCAAAAIAAVNAVESGMSPTQNGPATAGSPDTGSAQATLVQGQQIPMPWPMKIGLQSFQVSMRLPVVDQVVLVPDAATYLDEIGRWDLRGRWPVLIEDGKYASMFVRAFKPARVVRRASVGSLPAGRPEREALAQQAVTRAWTVPGKDTAPKTLAEAYAAVGFQPFGAVFASMDDPAWTAAVALTAGRGQAPFWVAGSLGQPSDTLGAEQFRSLAQQIEDAVRSTGLPALQLGDAIDAVTICLSMPLKADPPRGSRAQAIPQGIPAKPGEPVATVDGLCRNEDGSRWAVASNIFGDEVRCAYVAMSSLFLAPRSVWLVNTYPSDGEWAKYSLTDAATVLRAAQFDVFELSGAKASVTGWLNLLMSGCKAEVLFMNSMGNMDFFKMWQEVECWPEDVPVLHHPLALHFIHSWSLTSAQVRETVGGRWLENGAYAYAGSVYEPYLVAFVPPQLVAARTADLMPFLVASRWLEGPIDATWRVTLFGDPLMVIPPPSQPRLPRVAPPELDATKGESDLRAAARASLVAAKGSGAAADFAAAMSDVERGGDDALAVQLWTLASSKGEDVRAACASAALGPLFRARESDAFLTAYKSLATPSPADQDMLWQLWTQQLGSIKDEQTLAWFAKQVRPARSFVDLSRLAPEIKRVSGANAALEVVGAWLIKEQSEPNRTRLKELMAKIP